MPATAVTVLTSAEQHCLTTLQRSGLFDGAWFTARNPDLHASSHAALLHWHRYGWRERRWPNPYFDTSYYLGHAPDCTGDPLLHYIATGEAAGYRPVPYFDPAWYRTQHAVPPGELCLAHFLRHRSTGRVSPIAEFDGAFYLRTNPDVAETGMDPLEHYLVRGHVEGRAPCPGYRHGGWSGGKLDPNPLLGLLRWRERQRRLDGPNIAEEVRRNTRPNPGFEEVSPLPPGLAARVKLLAYYLPQYHPGGRERCGLGTGIHGVDQSRPRAAPLRRASAAAHPA